MFADRRKSRKQVATSNKKRGTPPSVEWKRVRKWLMEKELRVSVACKECANG